MERFAEWWHALDPHARQDLMAVGLALLGLLLVVTILHFNRRP